MKPQKTALIILDGWGIGSHDPMTNAIEAARTPFMDKLLRECPHATLRTDGTHVGLPDGQMGNSEVGHMNIGAGRVVYQDLLRIDRAIESGEFGQNEELIRACQVACESGRRLHLMGLVSKGGVHSQQAHLHQLVDEVVARGVKDVVIHAFTDGRDTSPMTGRGYLTDLERHIEGTPAKIATVHGRYYAMDRDSRWERVRESFLTLTQRQERNFASADLGVEKNYEDGVTDEFIPPFQVEGVDGLVRPGDVVICFNFRTDRCREITMALTQQAFPEHGMEPLDLHYVTMTNYDDSFEDVHVMYDKPNLVNTLGEVVSKAGRTQLRMAETEKYPHVTFFFSGGREEAFPGEQRVMAPSPKVATYDLKPEMSAHELKTHAVDALQSWRPDFLCLNFANPDMVGHTGVFDAVVDAVETTDSCLAEVFAVAEAEGYAVVVIADHGNADLAKNSDGSPHTAHTTNPVPVVVSATEVSSIASGILADVAPTILRLMGVQQPDDMTGQSLVR